MSFVSKWKVAPQPEYPFAAICYAILGLVEIKEETKKVKMNDLAIWSETECSMNEYY